MQTKNSMDSLNTELKHPQIGTWEETKKFAIQLKAQGKKLVFTNGCFDILHPGHLDLLCRAKSLGDILILGLNTDASVKRLGKGDERPIHSYPFRAFMAIHLKSVDFVTYFDEDTPLKLIQFLKPDILVKGGDWPIESIVGHEEVLQNGGEVFSLPLLGDFSTSKIVAKLSECKAK